MPGAPMETKMEKITVKNRAGVEYDATEIHDLWHIGQMLKARRGSGDDGQKVLDVWHLAHALRDEVLRHRSAMRSCGIARRSCSCAKCGGR